MKNPFLKYKIKNKRSNRRLWNRMSHSKHDHRSKNKILLSSKARCKTSLLFRIRRSVILNKTKSLKIKITQPPISS